MQEPQTRITPPLRRTPPGQQRGQPPSSSRGQIRSSVSMSSKPVSTPQRRRPTRAPARTGRFWNVFLVPTWRDQRLAFSLNAHHDSLQLTQLQGGLTPIPAGPTPEGQQSSISRIAPHFRKPLLHQPPSAFVTHGPPGSQHEELRACLGSPTARGPPTTRDSVAGGVAFRQLRGRRHPELGLSRLNSLPARPLPTLRRRPCGRPTHGSGPSCVASTSM
jgi:hypothetical protein